MRKNNRLRFFILVLFIAGTTATVDGQRGQERKIKWEKERLAPGLVLKSGRIVPGDTLPQNLNLLIVNTRKRDVSIIYNPQKGRRLTGVQAQEAGAIAAVNGGFFNTAGGSVTYVRTAGIIADSDTAEAWPKNVNLNGAIMVNSRGEVTITKKKTNEWFDANPDFVDVLVTGPFLAEGGAKSELPATSLVTARHPRTAVGKAGRRKVILLTADGRSDEAAGLTLHQLAGMMLYLKCSEALNLDGGGSTTMWVKGKPFGGVVNMPSDNKVFDHEGARAVSSVLIVR
ncbi:MAG: phosphodiester glycosidase family protein [Bacteroidales bacterium]